MAIKYEVTAQGESKTVRLTANDPADAAKKAVKKFISKFANKVNVTADGAIAGAAAFNVTADEFGKAKNLRLYVARHTGEPAEANDASL